MDGERPTIRALIAWPLYGGHVILSQQDTVTLEDAVDFHRMGWIVLLDPDDERLFAEWEREQHWTMRRRWL